MEPVAGDFVFPEGLRWHDGSLWLSDIHRHQVLRVGVDGHREVVVELDDRPSGLGFTADGAVLVVSLLDRGLLEIRGAVVRPYADLRSLSNSFVNDMVTDGVGRSYVGCRNQGMPGEPTDCLALVDAEGCVSRVAEHLVSPNGIAVAADLSTLVVAETHAERLTAFDIRDDGRLDRQRPFAGTDGQPDGICLDEEGAVWAAFPQESCVARIHEGGEVAERIALPGLWPFTCALGGGDRRTLFVAAGRSTLENFARLGLDRALDHTSESHGWVFSRRVGVAGAGWP